MSARAPVFEVERFERVRAGAHVLLRVAGRWRAPARVPLSALVLLVDDGREVSRFAPLAGPGEAAPVASPDPALWRAAFAVPAAQLTGDRLAYALKTSHGTVDLPPPAAPERAPSALPRAAIGELNQRLAAEREQTEQARREAQRARARAQALEDARVSAEAQAAERAEALAAVRAELARANEAARIAAARDAQSTRALGLARTIERERDQAVVAARAAAERAERTTARMRALERERDELRPRADAAQVAERQVHDLGARVAELEEVRRSLAEVADRVPQLEGALAAAQERRQEVEELAQRTAAEVAQLRAAHAQALQRAALGEQAQSASRRLVARVAELEKAARQREEAAHGAAERSATRMRELERDRDEARAALAQAADRLRAERDRAATSAQAAESRAAELQAQALRSAQQADALEADREQARTSLAALEELRARDTAQLRAAQSEIERLASAGEAQSASRAEAEALAALVRTATERATAAEEEAAGLRRHQQRALKALREADAERDRREATERALERADDVRASLAARVAELEQSSAALADRATQAELEAEFALAREREHATALDVLERWPVLVLALIAVPVGLVAGIEPAIAAALLGGVVVAALVVVAPVVHFALLIAITAIVPYEWQQAAELGAGGAGLQLADLLLITGLARAAVMLVRRPPRGLTAAVCALMVVFMAFVLAQGVHGWLAGHQPSQVVYETREVLTWGTLLIAVPLLMDPRRRSQLLTAMMGVGLLVGLWGIAQWILDIPFGEAGDAGVQAGVALTSSGAGQVQGALFAFPVAVLIGLAVLVSGGARSPRARAVLVAILVINALSLLLTFERSLWVATVAGVLFIMLRASAANRFKAIITMALVVLLALPVLATIAPGALTTARERLLSIGQYGSDNSVRFRIDESRFVFDRIADQPVVGSGMGATIHWGRPYDRVPASSTPFSHNSVLWLSWKLGVPMAVLLLAMIASAFVPRRFGDNATNTAVRYGAQAALVAMFIIGVTFQSLASRPITPTLGLVLALCVAGAGGASVRATAQAQRAEPVACVR